jgi:hypothetical protein
MLSKITYQKYKFQCWFQGDAVNDYWIANDIRGDFGNQLRELTCLCPENNEAAFPLLSLTFDFT